MANSKKAKFNIVDAAVLLIVITAILFAVYRYAPRNNDSDNESNIVFYLKIEDISSSFTDKISPGDKVLNFDDGSTLGTVSEISTVIPFDSSSQDEDVHVLYVTVITTAEDVSDGFLVNGTNISAGNRMKIRFPDLYCECECIGAKTVNS